MSFEITLRFGNKIIPLQYSEITTTIFYSEDSNQSSVIFSEQFFSVCKTVGRRVIIKYRLVARDNE